MEKNGKNENEKNYNIWPLLLIERLFVQLEIGRSNTLILIFSYSHRQYWILDETILHQRHWMVQETDVITKSSEIDIMEKNWISRNSFQSIESS